MFIHIVNSSFINPYISSIWWQRHIVNFCISDILLWNFKDCHWFCCTESKANLRDLIAVTGLVFSLKIGFKSLIFGPMWPGNLMEDLKKNNSAPLLCQALYIISKPSVNSNWSYSSETLNWVKIGDFFLSPVTSKFHGLPWETTGHIFSVTSSFVLHLIAIYQFKMGLQSRNTKFG